MSDQRQTDEERAYDWLHPRYELGPSLDGEHPPEVLSLAALLAEVRREERERCARVAESYSQAEGQLDDGAAIARDIRNGGDE